MSRGLHCPAAFRVQSYQRITVRPSQILELTSRSRANPCLRATDRLADLNLRHASRLNF